MKHSVFSILGLLLCLLTSSVFGQETLISDSATIYPFEGTIAFKITYEGKVDAKMRPYLPDSATLFVGKEGFCYTYHGGIANDLQTQMLWESSSQKLWLIDVAKARADSFPDYYKGLPYKSKKLNEKLKVAGHSTAAYALIAEKGNNKVWVSDSIFYGGMQVDSLKAFQPPFLAAGMRQIPLQSLRTNDEGVTIKMTAKTISPAILDEKLFLIPENFEKGPFDPFEVHHPMLSN